MFAMVATKTKRRQSQLDREISASGSPLRQICYHVLQTPAFDYAMGVLIMFNMVVIIVETDHNVDADEDETVPWIVVSGWIILTTFVLELLFRLFVFRKAFWQDKWNVVDFFIVGIDAIFSTLAVAFGDVFPVSILRVFRLGKLARVSKVFRIFPELRLMMAGLLGSVRAIFWGAVLLSFALVVWGIVAVQFIHPLNEKIAEKGGLDGCERCPRAYSTVAESVLTFSQQIVAGDSWGQATVPVIEYYPATGIFFSGVFFSVGIALLNLILGIVVNIAQQEHERLKTEMELEKTLARGDAQENLLQICISMDADGSGELTRAEIMDGYKVREDFRQAVHELQLQEEDLPVVFGVMDADKTGTVSYKEFVEQMYKLKDTDTEFMIASMKYQMGTIRDSILTNIEQQSNQMKIVEQAEIAALQKIQSQEKVVEDQLNRVIAVEEKKAVTPQKDTEATLPMQTEVTADTTLSPEKQDISVDLRFADQICQEITSKLMNSSVHNHGDLKGLLQDIKATLEVNNVNTSRLLDSIVQRQPLDDAVPLLTAPRAPGRFLCLPACPRGGTQGAAPQIPSEAQVRGKLVNRA